VLSYKVPQQSQIENNQKMGVGKYRNSPKKVRVMYFPFLANHCFLACSFIFQGLLAKSHDIEK